MIRNLRGKKAENIAAHFLKRRGFLILKRNFRCRWGEIDIIAQDKDELVCVEVRSQSEPFFMDPLESVTEAKIRRLKLLMGIWLEDRRAIEENVRFDLVGILFHKPPRQADIIYLKNAFS